MQNLTWCNRSTEVNEKIKRESMRSITGYKKTRRDKENE
jgi:hypothetical protein